MADEPISRILYGEKRRSDHSSRSRLAPRLERPTRGLIPQALAGSRLSQVQDRCTDCAFHRNRLRTKTWAGLPSYLALHHAGFSVPPRLPEARWALTPPFHPYLRKARGRSIQMHAGRRFPFHPATEANDTRSYRTGGLVSVALSVTEHSRERSPGVTRRVALGPRIFRFRATFPPLGRNIGVRTFLPRRAFQSGTSDRPAHPPIPF